MRLSQRLIDENKKNEKDKRRKAYDRRQAEDEDVETLTYHEPIKTGYLNDSKSVFQSDMGKGINTDPDIFERTAIFKTKKKENTEQT